MPPWDNDRKADEFAYAGGILYFRSPDPSDLPPGVEIERHGAELWAFPLGEELLFRRGDATANGELDVTDAIRIFGFLFSGADAPPCADAADADDDGMLAITDGIFLLGHLFLGSERPPLPGPFACGIDVTNDQSDSLPRCEYPEAACAE